ncbi:hypothetical protein [uncultured Desulfovibrio sp.]|jgi:hypothetical protein|uniref:virion core protein, T7 gp14 family n=1 Tax=uncultured Desulfovibrio sp. TaxID=167968 RepID=UPI002805160D|nr:hypothetical protein [uncultured Desulfovibrio sp.]
MSGYASATAAVLAIAGTAVSTTMSMQAQQKQAQQQKASAEYQAKIAEQNQEQAQEQAASVKRQGYDDAQRQRLKAAGIIGTQRAIAGASGVTVDTGSNLDLTMETAEKGELDALAIQQQSLDKAHNLEIQGWNSGQQAAAYSWQANNLDPTAGMIGTALGGLAKAGSNFGSGLWGGTGSKSPLWGSTVKKSFSSTSLPLDG